MKHIPDRHACYAWLLAASVALCALSGCVRTPSIDVEGSFLPSWMLCLLAGSLVSVAVYSYILRRKLQRLVAPAILFYISLTVVIACLVWLLLFR
jgi:uncharacterized membrane protein